MAPPASDADKWFITVLTMQGCSGCEQLQRDWTKNESLLALADPGDPKKSWAHYNVYDAADESQRFRFENIKVRVYPTILVQPPRTGRYGDPSTVVYQGVYGGKPDELARNIVGAMRRYVAKVVPQSPANSAPGKGTGQAVRPAVGIDPPWQPTPKATPQPNQFPMVDPTIPPPAPNASPSLATILALLAGGGLSMSLVIGLVVIGLQLYRNYRKATNQPVVLNDEQFVALVATLQALAQSKSTANVATPVAK